MASSLREVEAWLDKAEQTLRAARVLTSAHLYGDSVSRSYYAMFYAAKAATVHEGIQTKKHSGVISAFGREFAKTGRVDARLHKALAEAFEERQGADYTIGQAITEERANERVVVAAEFVEGVRRLLTGASDAS